MAQHTPGPWSVEADMRIDVDHFSAEKTRQEYVSGYNIVSNSEEIVGCEGILSDGEANARLIAAAPEMLVAGKHLAVKLAEIYRAAGADPGDCQAITQWLAAVHSAEGN